MKILYLITKSEIGGAQTHVYQMSKFLKEKGHQVAVISHSGGWLEKKAKNLGIKFFSNKYFQNTYNLLTIIKAIKRVKEIIKEFNPDLISCHSTIAGVAGRIAGRSKAPVIFTAHGWAFTKGVPFLRKIIAIVIEKLMAFLSSKIICVSNFDKELALKYKIASPDKLITIHNGVELNKKLHEETKNKKVNIVFVGRLSQQKDPLLLLKVIDDLSSSIKNKIKVTFVGGGPKRKKMEEFIKENNLSKIVDLLGNVSRKQVFSTLQKSDIFVLSTNWEGFPRSILEAMSIGLPIIASNVGGINEQVVNNKNGYLVPQGNEKTLKEKLIKLIKNPALREKMGQNSRKKVSEKFSLQKLHQRTYQVYKEVLNKDN